MTIRLAQVVGVFPITRRVSLVYLDSGARIDNVPLLSRSAASDCGSWAVPAVDAPNDPQAGSLLAVTRRMVAAVDSDAHGHPVVVGFFPPQGAQVTATEQNREIHRHPSGAYWTIAPDGSVEVYHPGGGYVRIGTGAHQDLAPLTAGDPWQLPPAAAPQITAVTAGFTLVIVPGGNTTLTSDGTLTATVKGAVSVATQADLTLQAAGNMTLKAGGTVAVTGATINLN